MNAEEAKYAVFLEVWHRFEKIRFVLLEAGISEDRLLPKEAVEKKLYEWHHNKIQDTLYFITDVTNTTIKAWWKIRLEHPEDYWKRAKLLKWGDEFTEIRELNKISKEIREKWFSRRNVLVRQKKRSSAEKEKISAK